MLTSTEKFATKIVTWQKQHGRNDLPWQNTRDPYRVWLSEIMLQQTQVLTVRNYFLRFLAKFPNVASLASASLDEVLGLWSGLGYYTRARNLHRCAQSIMENHGGTFPQTAAVLVTLPGIGRSTAAAISSLCFGERVAILDANVKRVVTRFLGFALDLAATANERALWDSASTLLPEAAVAAQDMARYTQGMMDLGATICLPKNPMCPNCPIQEKCVARAQGDPQRYPLRTRKLKRSSQSLWMLWAQTDDGEVWLTKRPTPGVWAALYCLPLFDSEEALRDAIPMAWRGQLQSAVTVTHVLTHKDLYLHPRKLQSADFSLSWPDGQWVDASVWPTLGLPAPIRKLLALA